MPARNIVKTYVENGYYHIYNRGVEKRSIFLEEQDCNMFLYYMKLYLSPREEIEKLLSAKKAARFLKNNLSKEIDLLSFALMPNHIHLELKQYTKEAIQKLIHRLSTSYVMYFNTKYHRVGSLFQNTYKAVFIDRDEYLLWLSRYIHRNPFELHSKIDFLNYSSYPYYLGEKQASWIKPQEILSYFSAKNPKLSYKSFVEDEEGENLLPEELFLDED